MEKRRVLGLLALIIVLAGLVVGYLYSSDAIRLYLLGLMVLVAVTGIVLLLRSVTSPAGKLQKALRELEGLLTEENLEMVKELYRAAYTLYLKLPEKHKRNFYAAVVGIREKIVAMLRVERKMQESPGKADEGSEGL